SDTIFSITFPSAMTILCSCRVGTAHLPVSRGGQCPPCKKIRHPESNTDQGVIAGCRQYRLFLFGRVRLSRPSYPCPTPPPLSPRLIAWPIGCAAARPDSYESSP